MTIPHTLSHAVGLAPRGKRLRMGAPQIVFQSLNTLVVAFPVLCAAWLGLTTYAPFGSEAAIGIATGAAALVAMSEALILAARPKILEPLFGGLDRMYRTHKWLGIFSMGFMVLHDLIEPDFERAVRETTLGEIAEEAGELVFYALLALVAISWFRRLPVVRIEIPYQLWRFSHRFMGVLFSVVAFHQFFIDMPSNVDPRLEQVLDVFCVLGIWAWLHIEFIAPRLRKRKFRVQNIDHFKDSVKVVLAPKGRPMKWRPGQFVFVRSPEAGLAEPHPFTIASVPNENGTLTLVIKTVGDWTRRLPTALRKDMAVQVEGPYGLFNFRKGAKRQVWLAGGVGVTPFLAWSESLTAKDRQDIHLVVSVRNEEDQAIFLPALQAAKARNPNFDFQIVVTSVEGRLTADRLVETTPFPIGTADLWFCGPQNLRDHILSDLEAIGHHPKRVRFEYFEFA